MSRASVLPRCVRVVLARQGRNLLSCCSAPAGAWHQRLATHPEASASAQ
jgi:hypothetical protein